MRFATSPFGSWRLANWRAEPYLLERDVQRRGTLESLLKRRARGFFVFYQISYIHDGEGGWVYYLTDPIGDIICLRELLDVIGNCSRSPVEEGSCSALAARERNSGLFIPAGKEFHCGESLDALRVHK